MRLVLVDDHDIVVAGLRLTLVEAGHEVVAVASSAADALGALSRTLTDLVVLDLSLPDMPGPRCVEEIRRQHPLLPVLVMAAQADENLALEAMRAGAGGYQVKYAQRDQLLVAVEAVASGASYLHPDVSRPLLLRLAGTNGGSQASLNPREREVLDCLAEGLSNPEIAARLHLSMGGVKALLSGLFNRLHVKDRTRLLVRAMELGLIPPRQPHS